MPSRTERRRLPPVARVLRELREALGLNQEQVADMLGCRQSQVSSWENGRALPRADYVAALALVYRTSADRILADLAYRSGEKIIRNVTPRGRPLEPAAAKVKSAGRA